MRQKMGPLHWVGFVVILIWCLLPVAWMFVSVIFFNTLRNVRVMVGLAISPKKKKKGDKSDKAAKELPAETK